MKTKRIIQKQDIISMTKDVGVLLFPLVEDRKNRRVSQKRIEKQLKALLSRFNQDLKIDEKTVINRFISDLPVVKNKLEADASFILYNDPAAGSIDEVIMTYPGFYAILINRISNLLYKQKVPLIPRIMTEYAHSITGIDIHPGASIGDEFFIDHGTGIVIGETSVIGNKVKIYQGVTIGALSVNKKNNIEKRHPTIEDNVIIYAGSTILGGDTIIGHDSIIGGNVWLTSSVPPFSLVQHKSEVTIRKRNNLVN